MATILILPCNKSLSQQMTEEGEREASPEPCVLLRHRGGLSVLTAKTPCDGSADLKSNHMYVSLVLDSKLDPAQPLWLHDEGLQ
jgi:hypothetical protein